MEGLREHLTRSHDWEVSPTGGMRKPGLGCSATRSLRGVAVKRGYGLADLSAEFGIDFKHHDATEDAYATGMILLRAMTDTGLTLDDWFTRVEQPIFAIDGHHARAENPTGPLAGEVIVFTGKLEMPRSEAAGLAASAGCNVADGVTKETTILVVGDQDIRVLNGHAKSAKHRKAEKLIENGAKLRIVGESDFRLLVADGQC